MKQVLIIGLILLVLSACTDTGEATLTATVQVAMMTDAPTETIKPTKTNTPEPKVTFSTGLPALEWSSYSNRCGRCYHRATPRLLFSSHC